MAGDVLILGGGLAGGAAAVLLARAGCDVTLLEREAAAHHKVCGEFLSVEAGHDLSRLGLDPERLGAVGIDRVRLVWKDREVEASLPFAAHGISRKILDEALLAKAEDAGARIERGVRVTAVEDMSVSTSAGSCTAEHILLATGKHDVRGTRRPPPAEADAYVGFKTHWRANRSLCGALERVIELVVLEGGYAGLQLVAPDVVNLCLIVRKTRLAEAGGNWDGLLAELMREPGLGRRLSEAQPIFPRPLTIANLPYGFVWDAVASQRDEPIRLGDQAAMTASLTGDGMAAALRSAFVVALGIRSGLPGPAIQERVRRVVQPQVRRAMLLQRAAEAPLALQLAMPILRLFPGLLGALGKLTRLPGGTGE